MRDKKKGRKKKPTVEKVLDYLSSPRPGKWIAAKDLSRRLRTPLEHLEHELLKLNRVGLVHLVRDKKDKTYWLQHIWQKQD